VEDPNLQIAAQGETILQIGRRRVVKVIFDPSPAS